MSRVSTLVLSCALLVACGGARPTLRPGGPSSEPAQDLAQAKPAPSAAPATRGPAEAADPRVIDLDTVRIQVVGRTATGELELSAVAAADLFNDASAAWKNGQGEVAIAQFRRVVVEFPESGYAPLALHNIAAVYDRRGDVSATVATLRELIGTYPRSRKAAEAQLYLGALLAEHKQWKDAAAELSRALTRDDLTYADRVEASARRGYVLLEDGQLDAAERALGDAVSDWRRAPRLDDPYFIAMAQYYLGEVAHRRFLAAKVELPDDNLGRSLASKEALAVAAYDRWREALGHRHAYWATASGYQMSQVFVELWQATVRAPFPVSMSREARPYYVAEVHERVRPHLQKALEGHRMNVQLAEAYGVTTSWADGSRARILQISEILDKESRGEYSQPAP